mmetsp:Transcript_4542/g.16123  ORF Transcript_4542/g.16123 Transcript_4542/m.16123 type:complete len:319 (+) Transcript_4542:114-1070(+)
MRRPRGDAHDERRAAVVAPVAPVAAERPRGPRNRRRRAAEFDEARRRVDELSQRGHGPRRSAELAARARAPAPRAAFRVAREHVGAADRDRGDFDSPRKRAPVGEVGNDPRVDEAKPARLAPRRQRIRAGVDPSAHDGDELSRVVPSQAVRAVAPGPEFAVVVHARADELRHLQSIVSRRVVRAPVRRPPRRRARRRRRRISAPAGEGERGERREERERGRLRGVFGPRSPRLVRGAQREVERGEICRGEDAARGGDDDRESQRFRAGVAQHERREIFLGDHDVRDGAQKRVLARQCPRFLRCRVGYLLTRRFFCAHY